MVRTKIKNETNSGNRKGWSKHVTAVDPTKSNGYAFGGSFIPDSAEVELPVGAVIVQKHPEGSVKHSWESGHVYRLGSDGALYETNGRSYHWTKDFLSFRDQVVAALLLTNDPAVLEDQPETSAGPQPEGLTDWQAQLATVPTEELLKALRGRGQVAALAQDILAGNFRIDDQETERAARDSLGRRAAGAPSGLPEYITPERAKEMLNQ